MEVGSRFTVHTVPVGGEGQQQVVDAFWGYLLKPYPELASHQVDGVHQVTTNAGVQVRWCGSRADGVLAVEVVDLFARDAWEAFVLPAGEQEMRIGWCRSGDRSGEAPQPWEELAIEQPIGQEVVPAREPNFIALVAAVSAPGVPALEVTDYELRLHAGQVAQHWRSEAERQAREIQDLQGQLVAFTGVQPGEDAVEEDSTGEPEQPKTMQDVVDWISAHTDLIEVMPRALAELKKSVFERPSLLLDALDVLAVSYRAVRTGQMERVALKARTDELGLFIRGSIEKGRAGAEGDDYFVQHRGRRVFLDQHIGRGTSRDARYTLRVYFFYDSDTQRVVVGSMPGHLNTTIT